MTERILSFHLGDNASHPFPNSVYIGTTAALPIRITSLVPAPEPVQLIVRTSGLETLSPLQAHVITLDGFELGGSPTPVPEVTLRSTLCPCRAR